MLDKFFGELVGTFIFLSVIITSGHATSRCADSFVWIKIGLALSVAILLVGALSGAQLNPAVSVMLFLNKELTIPQLIVYVAGQLFGAVLAYFYYIYLKKNYKNSM